MKRILTVADYVTTPWKNGRGSTTEITRAAMPSAGSFDFAWRVSMAPVSEDGPFSSFPGIERTLIVIEGTGLDLQFADGKSHHLSALEPFSFDGAASVVGRLTNGPVRDFNVMVRRDAWRSKVHVLRSADGFDLEPAAVTLFHPVEGGWQVTSAEGADMIAPGQTLWLSAGAQVRGSGAAIAVHLNPD